MVKRMTNKERENSLLKKRRKIYQKTGVDPSGYENYCKFCSHKWWDSEGIIHCDVPYELGCDPTYFPCAKAYNRMIRKNQKMEDKK